jgi:hypothetical protein
MEYLLLYIGSEQAAEGQFCCLRSFLKKSKKSSLQGGREDDRLLRHSREGNSAETQYHESDKVKKGVDKCGDK